MLYFTRLIALLVSAEISTICALSILMKISFTVSAIFKARSN